MRGFLERRRLAQQHAAATAIQHAVRAYLGRKRAAAVAAVKQQMAEMARLLREYGARTAAAKRIQVGIAVPGQPSAGLAMCHCVKKSYRNVCPASHMLS